MATAPYTSSARSQRMLGTSRAVGRVRRQSRCVCWLRTAARIPNPHRLDAKQDLPELYEPLEYAFLDVWYVVLFAEGFDARLNLLVLPHRQIRPQVVFDLVV